MNIIERIKNIIVSPKTEWEKIAIENQSMSNVITSYVLPLTLIGAVAAFIGYGLIGIDTGFLGIRIKGMDWGLYMAINKFITGILAVIICTYVVDMLAPSFGSEKNLNRSAQLVAYAYTPAMIGAFLNVVPMLGIIGSLCGLYGIYLWYLGLGPMKKTPEDKKVVYLVVSILVLIVISFIIGLVMNRILGSIFGVGAFGTGLGYKM
ncbi:MAG: Yip1 family protein [Ferruginibacter sp.]